MDEIPNPPLRPFKIITVLMLLCHTLLSHGTTPAAAKQDSSYWHVTPTAGLFFSQQSFSPYYKGGGVNSIAVGHHSLLEAKYEKEETSWENKLVVRYGVIKVAGHALQKNEDHLEIDSKYSHEFSKHLRISGLFNLKTRMHDAYELGKDGSRGKRIGNFLAPAFINVGSGLDYLTKDKCLSIYYTPVNSKITIVTEDGLREQYFPQDRQDGHARYEFGSLLRLEIKKKLMDNIFVHSTGTFFTNHLQGFGIFDVDIENKINFKVNKFFSVNLLTHLIYDEDILFDIVTTDPGGEGEVTRRGPRTQFKEVLNIGLSHTF